MTGVGYLFLYLEIWLACAFVIFLAIGANHILSNRAVIKSFFLSEMPGPIILFLAIFFWTSDGRTLLVVAGLIFTGVFLGAIAPVWKFITAKKFFLPWIIPALSAGVFAAGLIVVLCKAAEIFCWFLESNNGRGKSWGLGPACALYVAAFILAVFACWIYRDWRAIKNSWIGREAKALYSRIKPRKIFANFRNVQKRS